MCPLIIAGWKRGEAAVRGIHREFWDAVKGAEAEGQQKLIQVVREAATSGYQEVERVTTRDGSGTIVRTVETQRSSSRDWRAAKALLGDTLA